jgi:hypothetical protein
MLPWNFIIVKDVCAHFNLHQLWFQHTNTNCVEVVALIRWLCFYVVIRTSDWFLEKHVDLCSCLPSQLTTFCQNLSQEIKPSAFNMILKANNKVVMETADIHTPKKACKSNSQMKTMFITLISRVLFNLNSFHKASQPSLLCGNNEVVMWRWT